MNMQLIDGIEEKYINAVKFDKFFSIDDREKIALNYAPRENPNICDSKERCTTNLFFGFFFDGTKNNYIQAEEGNNYSNIARLYDCYPGRSVPGVLPPYTDWRKDPELYQHFFKVYAPGVSSPFEQVGDMADWLDERTGGASGRMGERRILWCLVQAINNVHRYFLGTPLVPRSEMDKMFDRVTLNKWTRRAMTGERPRLTLKAGRTGFTPAAHSSARIVFEQLLERLHKSVAQHWPDRTTGRPAKIAPATVKTIYISIFGFSRGATQARAFTNWLQSLCKLDSQLVGATGGMSLGGFPVQFDFLGLFDTVAAIGVGNTLGGTTGHGAWADSEDSLRIPPDVPCLHIVAAHEIRRSFPVDSISVGGNLVSGHQEIVMPGVHSDIGCGYCPGEQGRGIHPNGDDMLARISLILMYKTARLSGVPLKLELAGQEAQDRFALTRKTVVDFNAYIASCKVKKGPLHQIMREQARKYIEWRVWRRISGKHPVQSSGSFARASTFDKNDLYSASLEFEDEIKKFVDWMRNKGVSTVFQSQRPGFGNDHEAEWLEIATWWKDEFPLSSCIVDFFDNYVHDSRAWFKLVPGNPDSEKLAHEQLQGWQSRRELGQAKVALSTATGKSDYEAASDRLSPAQRKAVDEYKKTKEIPRMVTAGREPWDTRVGWLAGAGYLRFRKIYGGHDSVLLSSIDAPAPEQHPDVAARV